MNLGLVRPIGNFHNGQRQTSGDLDLEFRKNVSETNWDCGLSLNVSTAVYKYTESTKPDWYEEQSNRSVNIMAVGDYNFKQGSWVNPYIGMGMGYSICEPVTGFVYDEWGTSMVIKPRVGVELFSHLRLGLFTTITKTGYSNWGFSVGGVIGGRPKKRK